MTEVWSRLLPGEAVGWSCRCDGTLRCENQNEVILLWRGVPEFEPALPAWKAGVRTVIRTPQISARLGLNQQSFDYKSGA